DEQRREDQDAAHGRRAGLEQMSLGAVIAARLAGFLDLPQIADPPPAGDAAEYQRGLKGAACTGCDMSKQVEEVAPLGKTAQPIEHYLPLLLRSGPLP